jgi:hypothetical protein
LNPRSPCEDSTLAGSLGARAPGAFGTAPCSGISRYTWSSQAISRRECAPHHALHTLSLRALSADSRCSGTPGGHLASSCCIPATCLRSLCDLYPALTRRKPETDDRRPRPPSRKRDSPRRWTRPTVGFELFPDRVSGIDLEASTPSSRGLAGFRRPTSWCPGCLYVYPRHYPRRLADPSPSRCCSATPGCEARKSVRRVATAELPGRPAIRLGSSDAQHLARNPRLRVCLRQGIQNAKLLERSNGVGHRLVGLARLRR